MVAMLVVMVIMLVAKLTARLSLGKFKIRQPGAGLSKQAFSTWLSG